MKSETGLKAENVTPDSVVEEEVVEKTAPDIFLEEFSKDWPIEAVRFGFDDGGTVLEIYCEQSKADGLRRAVPPKYQQYWTVVIGVEEGFGELL